MLPPTPDPLERIQHTILLAMALNRDRRWFSAAELQVCSRMPADALGAARWQEALEKLVAEGKVAMGRVVVGGWHIPMVRAMSDEVLPIDEAWQLQRSPRYQRWPRASFLAGDPPLRRVPAEDDELSIPPPPAPRIETPQAPA